MSRLDDLRAEAEEMLDNDDDLLIEVVNELDNINGFADGFRGFQMGELEEMYGEMRLTDFLSKVTKEFNVNDDYFYETIYGIESTDDLADVYRNNTTNDDIIDSVLVTPLFSVSDSDFMSLIADIDDYDEDDAENESKKVSVIANRIIEGASVRKALQV